MGWKDADKNILITIVSCLIGLSLFVGCTSCNDGGFLHALSPNSLGNVRFYALVVVVTFAVSVALKYLVSYHVVNPIADQLHSKLSTYGAKTIPLTQRSDMLIKYFLPIATIIILILIVLQLFFGQNIVIGIAISLLICVICFFNLKSPLDQKTNTIFKCIIEVQLLIPCIYAMFHLIGVETTFGFGKNGIWYDVYHSSAVIDSVYNTYHGVPPGYDWLTEQYGHYGLFLLPFLTIFGFSTTTLYTLFGIIAACFICFAYYFVRSVVESLFVRIMFICVGLASIVLAYQVVYWQDNPIRHFFPCLILMLCAIIQNKIPQNAVDNKKKIAYIVSIIASTIAIMWNTESGLVCSIAIGLFVSFYFIPHDYSNFKRIKTAQISLMIMIAVPITLQIGLLEAYSFIVGNQLISISQLFGGMFNGDYVSHLQTELEWQHIHTAIIFAAVGLFIYSLYSIFSPSHQTKENKNKYTLYLQVSVICIGMLTKHILRPVSPTDIANPYFIIILAIYLDLCVSFLKKHHELGHSVSNWYKKIAQSLFIVICSTTFLSTFMPPIIDQTYENTWYNHDKTTEFDEFIDELKDNIDPETYGMGLGTTELYMILGMNNKTIYFHENTDKDTNLSQYKHLLITGGSKAILPPEFELVNIIEYREIGFYYYENTQMIQ